jgi:large subunit ribosomal protein L18
MDAQKLKRLRQLRRRRHVRKRVRGTPERPRLTVFRSHKHIYAQIIDDVQGVTLVSASSRTKDVGLKKAYGGNKDAAVTIGKKLAEIAKSKGVTKVCFDRGHYRYHGRVKALADAAREGGLQF